jgi:hypothetical protein
MMVPHKLHSKDEKMSNSEVKPDQPSSGYGESALLRPSINVSRSADGSTAILAEVAVALTHSDNDSQKNAPLIRQ